METYHGHVRTPNDAIILFEACRIGLLPRVQRRLSEKERSQIKSGSVFVWDEREAGMRRWTDGKSWSASRVSGSFLTYREMEGKRGGTAIPTPPAAKRASGKSPNGSANGDSDGDGPDGYRYKPDGLMKQSFSITTSSGQHLHLISYYSRSNSGSLNQPTNDSSLRHIRPPKNMYPESTVNETQNVPAVTRAPMPSSPYTAPGQNMGPTSPYARSGPGPIAPMYAVPVYPPPTPPNGTPPVYYAQHPPPFFYGGVVYAPQMSGPNGPPGHGHPVIVQHPPPPPYAAHHSGPHYVAAPQHPPAYDQHRGAMPHPPPPASMPEPGPQLPAINGAAASKQSTTPEPSDRTLAPAEPNVVAQSRPLPTLGTILNGDGPEKDYGSNSRSGSRSPNTQGRFPRDLAPERLATSSSAADSSALNKLNSVFVRS